MEEDKKYKDIFITLKDHIILPEVLKLISEIDTKTLTFKKKISLLNFLFKYYKIIIYNYYNGSNGRLFLRSRIDNLNNIFIILKDKIIEIIENEKDFSDLKKTQSYKTALTFNDLYTSHEFIDILWDEINTSLLNIESTINELDLKTNFGEPFSIEKFYNNNEEKIEKMINFVEIIEIEIQNMKDTYKKINNKIFPPKEIVSKGDNIDNTKNEQITSKKTTKEKYNLKTNNFKIKVKKNKNIIGDVSKHKWEDIIISFIDNENVNIWVKDTFIGKYTFIELRMGKIKPNRIWKFLKILSSFNIKEIQKKGIRPELSKLLNTYDSKNTVEKLISDSSRSLKELFAKTENPFFKYKDFKEYRTKFKLKPEPIDNFQKNTFQDEEFDENSSYDDFEIHQ